MSDSVMQGYVDHAKTIADRDEQAKYLKQRIMDTSASDMFSTAYKKVATETATLTKILVVEGLIQNDGLVSNWKKTHAKIKEALLNPGPTTLNDINRYVGVFDHIIDNFVEAVPKLETMPTLERVSKPVQQALKMLRGKSRGAPRSRAGRGRGGGRGGGAPGPVADDADDHATDDLEVPKTGTLVRVEEPLLIKDDPDAE